MFHLVRTLIQDIRMNTFKNLYDCSILYPCLRHYNMHRIKMFQLLKTSQIMDENSKTRALRSSSASVHILVVDINLFNYREQVTFNSTFGNAPLRLRTTHVALISRRLKIKEKQTWWSKNTEKILVLPKQLLSRFTHALNVCYYFVLQRKTRSWKSNFDSWPRKLFVE